MIIQRFRGHGIDLAASVGGAPDQPSVVLLHGGGQTRHAWDRAARALGDAGHYVICLDLRGHGDSDWAPDGDYTLDTLVADLRAVIHQLPSKPILIGASLGGLIALTAVGESNESPAAGLVLVDVTPRVDAQGLERIETFMQAYPDGFSDLEEAADAVAYYMSHRPRPSDSSGLLRNLRLGEDGRYYWHWDPDLFSSLDASPALQSERYERAARRVRCPTLLTRGNNSELVKEENIKQFLALIPGASYKDIYGAGHMVAGDRNDAFNQAILAFIERTTAIQAAPD